MLAANCWNDETGSYDVTIEENQYKSISVDLEKPIQIIENSDGEWDTDNYGNDFFYYDYTICREGASITVTTKDNTEVVYTYDENAWEFINSEGEELIFDCYSDQYNKPWTLGKDNYFFVEAFGLKTQVPVEIIKKPYKSVSVTLAKPIQLIENTGGYWDYVYAIYDTLPEHVDPRPRMAVARLIDFFKNFDRTSHCAKDTNAPAPGEWVRQETQWTSIDGQWVKMG